VWEELSLSLSLSIVVGKRKWKMSSTHKQQFPSSTAFQAVGLAVVGLATGLNDSGHQTALSHFFSQLYLL
jgi:hypothetical protein